MSPAAVTTRFAPSPTGRLHLGHAYAALTAWQAADAGGFRVRIEDLDRSRARTEFETGIFEDLAWLGLRWPEPVLHQSARATAYRQALDSLAQRGLTYPCFCTRAQVAAEIARAGEAPQAAGAPADDARPYPGTCRALSRAGREQRIAAGEPHAIRLDVGEAQRRCGMLEFFESGAGPHGEHGRIAVAASKLGDIVLARKGLPAAYHLAVVVDDAFQGITLVTRGCDLFAATHVQRLLQALLDLPAPQYAHHRLILDAQGRRLSKRDRATALRSLRDQGVTAEEIRHRLGL